MREKEIQTEHLSKLQPVFERAFPNRDHLKNISMLSHRAFEFSNLKGKVPFKGKGVHVFCN